MSALAARVEPLIAKVLIPIGTSPAPFFDSLFNLRRRDRLWNGARVLSHASEFQSPNLLDPIYLLDFVRVVDVKLEIAVQIDHAAVVVLVQFLLHDWIFIRIKYHWLSLCYVPFVFFLEFFRSLFIYLLHKVVINLEVLVIESIISELAACNVTLSLVLRSQGIFFIWLQLGFKFLVNILEENA